MSKENMPDKRRIDALGVLIPATGLSWLLLWLRESVRVGYAIGVPIPTGYPGPEPEDFIPSEILPGFMRKLLDFLVNSPEVEILLYSSSIILTTILLCYLSYELYNSHKHPSGEE